MKDNKLDQFIIEELDKATAGISFSAELRCRIKAETIGKPRTRRDILRQFLNKRIELPVVPIVASVVILIVCAMTPLMDFQTFKGYSKIVVPTQYETISVGGDSIVIDKNAKGDDLYVNY